MELELNSSLESSQMLQKEVFDLRGLSLLVQYQYQVLIPPALLLQLGSCVPSGM